MNLKIMMHFCSYLFTMYSGLTKKLAHATLSGDVNERFYSYGYSKEKSTLLYCVNKHPLPNIFHCTVFKQHHGFLLDENQKRAEFSNMFMFLPSTLDRILLILKIQMQSY